MRAGSFDRMIRLERFSAADDGYNTTEDWRTLQDVPAQYLPSRGREAREALGRDALLPVVFRIRWAPQYADFGGADRVRFPATDDGKVYDVKSAVEIGRREGIEIVALANNRA